MKGMLAFAAAESNPEICVQCEYEDKKARIAMAEGGDSLSSPEIEERAKAILLSTTDRIYGRRIIEHIGFARGGTLRAKNAISDFGAGVKNLIGGEIVGYTKLMADAREQALHRLRLDAFRQQADAVVGVSFSTSMIDVGAAEIVAYGTAVRLENNEAFSQ